MSNLSPLTYCGSSARFPSSEGSLTVLETPEVVAY